MGNVNGREDGNGTPSGSGLVGEEEEEEEIVSAITVAGSPSALMGQSPPHSPRAAQSPLKFAPQPPVAPIQKPEELHIPNPSWLQTSPPEEDMNYEQGIPTMITWTHGGKEVAVEGSWDNWKTRIHLQRSGKDFTLMKVLPSGVYPYRFIVDGSLRYAPDIPWTKDEAGNVYNVLDLEDYVPEDTGSISGFEPPQSPEGSYNNTEFNQEDFAKEPPMVPPHLNLTLLNVPALCTEVPPPALSRPQHVVLNHLYMQKGKSGPSVVALGSTHRFKSKYVTVVLYKSL
ncbi:SNF1-related protein kinase regulatory subunit beta-2 [Amaranthus tricolor]|uniref:SNF1-related protein kinase regulatory subunit beta-2 n=1 Tax=Amaranthus tricolor TaxID=29722 RepID=UPI002590BABE|nr:SNF1-related protein kinase regulatory subunit beta-2 [Amaranthus tricolor]